MRKLFLPIAFTSLLALHSFAGVFEGKIEIAITRGTDITSLLYTYGENFLRIEVAGAKPGTFPDPVNIVDLKSGAMTIVYPHNRTFMKLTAAQADANQKTATPQLPAGMPAPPTGIGPQSGMNNTPPLPSLPPGAPPMPTPPSGLPPGIGPQASAMPNMQAAIPNMPPMPAGVGPQARMPAMPVMPPMPTEKLELKATGKKDKILGYASEQFELKQRGEKMEIWATDQLPVFQSYLRNQSPRFGPRMLEEQWPVLVTEKKMFPLRASLRFDMGPNGANATDGAPERMRFEVKSTKPGKITDEKLFQPPEGYVEMPPMAF